MIAQCSVFLKSKFCQHQQKTLEKQKLNFSCSGLFRMKTRVCQNYFVHGCSIEAGVPQGSIHGPLLFLIYINDLSNNLPTIAKPFADDINTSATHLNNDLRKINNWEFQWKMSFNSDLSKQAQDVIFSHKLYKISHLSIYFNNNPIEQVTSQNHLGMLFDTKLNFQKHVKNILTKVNKTIGLLRKLQNILPRGSLLAIFKSFVRPHLDYDDVIYDQSYNNTFHQKIESIKYKAALAITGATRDFPREKLHQELGLESLPQRRWYRKLCYFFKLKTSLPSIYSIISSPLEVHKEQETLTIFLNLIKEVLYKFLFKLPVSHTFFRNSY